MYFVKLVACLCPLSCLQLSSVTVSIHSLSPLPSSYATLSLLFCWHPFVEPRMHFRFPFFFFLFLFSSASMGFICPLLCPFVSFSLFCPFKLSLNYLFLSVTILRHFFTRNYYALLVYFRKQKYPWPLWSHSEFMIIV